MPRLTRIYTRTGDQGETALGGGQRVAKDDLRVAAYGDVDELNAFIGLARSQRLSPASESACARIQNELFHLGSSLCFREEDKRAVSVPEVGASHVAALEKLLDDLTARLGPLQNFILPGGSPGASALHVARAICRRAERSLAALQRHEPVAAQALTYLNRLSDALFVMARYENHERGVPEVLWDSRA